MKILFATDGSKQSEAAISTIKRFRLCSEGEVKIVSVVDMALPMPIDIYGGYLPDTGELERSARDNAARVVAEAAEKVRDQPEGDQITISTDVLFGSPDSRIVETAEEWQADLIVIGSHGYNRWERLLLGSVSDSVVHHAPCSVLVVRTAEVEEEN